VLPFTALLLLPALVLTARDYYLRWPQREDVQYFYQEDLTAVGRYLDTLEPEVSVAVAGLSVHSMDRPTLGFTTRSSLQALRLCDVRQTLVIPASGEAQVLIPRIVPFDELESMRRYLTAWAEVESYGAFTSYQVRSAAMERHVEGLERAAWLPDGTPISLPASFGDRLALLGYEWLQGEQTSSMILLTYWRVENAPAARLKAFLHLLGDGELVAQDDGLASPPQGWVRDDLIIQKHVLALAPDLPRGLYTPQVGLYNALSLSRLAVSGGDRLLLPPVEVGAP
jgi:hypothetical protein